MPDTAVYALLNAVRRRWRVRSTAFGVAVGGTVFAVAILLVPALWSMSTTQATWVAFGVGIGVAITFVMRSPRLSGVDAARLVERVHPGNNLLVTAAELEERPRAVRAEIQEEIARQADDVAQSIDSRKVIAIAQPIAVATAVIAGCLVLLAAALQTRTTFLAGTSGGSAARSAAGSFTVHVTPPAYSRRAPEVFEDPVQVVVLAGSRVQIGAIARDWIAAESEAIEIKPAGIADSKFLSVVVIPDLPPTLRIVTPGKDTAFATPAGRLSIAIQSGDDLGLAALSLRFTKASGGGENVSFTEGDIPLRVERTSQRDWRAHAEIALDALGLADGDILVYRAIARDTNPSGQPVQSDQYLIEIGKNASIADAGFALPSEEKKYAISQQMVIYRTEQLLKTRSNLRQGSGAADAEWMNESRGIAVEQRMVRAEVVFLGGGEVEDEVEEAAQSDELVAGRLQNTGRVEMLRAINAMSRAEAQLNDGRVQEALVFEREALVHLERALDRRRYFLRTLPDRSRIDATRRLTGERRDAASWNRDATSTPAPSSLESQRQVMRELAAGATIDARLAARLAAVDPASSELQKAAVALASVTSDAARQNAVREAMSALARHALRTLPASSAIALGSHPLSGRLGEELERTSGSRR